MVTKYTSLHKKAWHNFISLIYLVAKGSFTLCVMTFHAQKQFAVDQKILVNHTLLSADGSMRQSLHCAFVDRRLRLFFDQGARQVNCNKQAAQKKGADYCSFDAKAQNSTSHSQTSQIRMTTSAKTISLIPLNWF